MLVTGAYIRWENYGAYCLASLPACVFSYTLNFFSRVRESDTWYTWSLCIQFFLLTLVKGLGHDFLSIKLEELATLKISPKQTIQGISSLVALTAALFLFSNILSDEVRRF